ncbi:MAG: SbcC/MukB-like Walker B domain-containing protein [Moraxella sp.]|nr:SbcC/MukB-like Walker B domain-containing protein [Moraxella sp.]
MKILKLQLENINALKGKWVIDFNDEAFYAGGIFSITGQTGAGKSSILDAICLALYGMTPRLGKITKGNNELMHLDTGHCSAQVWLSINDKSYQFFFGQHRAKGKPDGALQEPKREISELKPDGTSQLLADRLKEADTLTPKLLGMDFEQFTRSVMLAQGGFAAFLQSDAHKRGELLEKITGTDIYAKLGVLAFETFKEKDTTIKEQRKLLNALNLPDPQQIMTLSDALAQTETAIKHESEALKALEEKIHLKKEQLQHLNANAQLDEALAVAKQAVADFSPLQNKLETNRRLLPLAVHYQKYHDLSLRHAEENHQIQLLNDRLNNQERQLDAAKLDQETANTAYEHAKHTLSKKAPLVQALREHELGLVFLEEQLAQKQTHYAEKQTALAALTTQHTKEKTALTKLVQTQATLQTDINRLASVAEFNKEANLVKVQTWQTLLMAFSNNVSTLKSEQADITALRMQLKQDELTLKNLQTDTQHQTETLFSLYRQTEPFCPAIKTDIEKDTAYSPENALNAEKALKTALAQQEKDLSAQQTQLVVVESVLETAAQKFHLTQKHQMLSSQINALSQALTQHEHEHKHAKAEFDTAQASLNLSREQYEMALKLHSLEALFEGLTPDTPCPLCGSTHHPYADNPEHKTDGETLLATAKALLTENEERLSQLEKKLSEASHILYQKTAEKTTQETTLAELEMTLLQLSAKLEEAALNFQADGHTDAELTPSHLEFWQALKETKTAKVTALQADLSIFSGLIHKCEVLTKDHIATHDTLRRHQETLSFNQDKLAQKSHTWKQTQHATSTQAGTLIEKSHELATLIGHQKTALKDDHPAHMALSGLDMLVQFANFALTIDRDSLPLLHQAHTTLKETLGEHFYDTLTTQVTAVMEVLHLCHQDHQTTQATAIETASAIALKTQALSDLETREKTLTHELMLAQDALTKAHVALEERTQAKEDLLKTHFSKHTSTAPEALSADLEAYLTQHERAFLNAEKTLETLLTQITNTKDSLKERKSTLTALEAEKDAAHAAFSEKLVKLGLDEIDYHAAHLDEEERERLETEASQLQHTFTTLSAKKEQTELLLAELKRTQPDIDTWELTELTDDHGIKKATLETLLTKLGEQKQQQKDAHTAQEKQTALLTAITKGEQEMHIWARLSELIGDSKGAKYRNFAQGLTLDFLLSAANDVLLKMSDRYELVRSEDEKNTLGIDVKDHYQNAQIRSSKNLSGGESFIISLALALGLSQMNSQKMHIESLFLDEGFGTLDEEALDVALSVLGQIEATGKSIGIISHVATLKERISTQIIVEKKSGGSSILKGAGVIRGDWG